MARKSTPTAPAPTSLPNELPMPIELSGRFPITDIAPSTGKRVLQDNEVAYRNPNYNVSQTNSINNRPVTTTPNGLKIGTP